MLKDRVVFSYQQYIENRLHIKSDHPVPIEKPFSKAHAPEFGRGTLEVLDFPYHTTNSPQTTPP